MVNCQAAGNSSPQQSGAWVGAYKSDLYQARPARAPTGLTGPAPESSSAGRAALAASSTRRVSCVDEGPILDIQQQKKSVRPASAIGASGCR